MLANWIKVKVMEIEKKLTVCNCHAEKILSPTPVQWFLAFYAIYTSLYHTYVCVHTCILHVYVYI